MREVRVCPPKSQLSEAMPGNHLIRAYCFIGWSNGPTSIPWRESHFAQLAVINQLGQCLLSNHAKTESHQGNSLMQCIQPHALGNLRFC